MCFAAAPFVAMGLTAVLSAANAASSAKTQNSQADYNTQVALNNAEISRQEGSYAQAQAMRNASEKRKETGVLIGAQRARQGASGVVVDSGSASDVVLDTAERGEREAMALLQQGDLEVWRAENQARGYEQQARLAQSGKVSVSAAVTGSLLSSGASSSMQYFSMGGFKSGGTSTTGGTNTYTGGNPYEPY